MREGVCDGVILFIHFADDRMMIARLRVRRLPQKIGSYRIGFALDLVRYFKRISGDPPEVVTHPCDRNCQQQANRSNNAAQRDHEWRARLAKHPGKQRRRDRQTEYESFVGTAVGQNCQTKGHGDRIADALRFLDARQPA